MSRASGLIDPDGYFWRDLASLRRHLVPEAAEAELRAQIERAIAAGLKPTHIDAHMAAAMLPELLEAHVRLGREFGLFPVLPRSIGWAPDPVRYREVVATLDAEGAPVVDHCRGTLAVATDRLEAGWRELVAELSPGTTHLALHCTAPGDFAAMAPAHAGWRYDEYGLLARGLRPRPLSRTRRRRHLDPRAATTMASAPRIERLKPLVSSLFRTGARGVCGSARSEPGCSRPGCLPAAWRRRARGRLRSAPR